MNNPGAICLPILFKYQEDIKYVGFVTNVKVDLYLYLEARRSYDTFCFLNLLPIFNVVFSALPLFRNGRMVVHICPPSLSMFDFFKKRLSSSRAGFNIVKRIFSFYTLMPGFKKYNIFNHLIFSYEKFVM